MATEDAVDVQAANERLAKMGINGTGGESRQEFENDRMGQTGADNAAKMRSSIPIPPLLPTREPRKRRSDAGLPRPKPEAPAPAQSVDSLLADDWELA